MSKEAAIRKKAIEILEGQGFVCWFAPKVKFKKTDIFGIVDLMALRGRQKKNIQITTLPNVSARRKKISAFLKKHQVEFPVEIWAWDKKRKTFKKEKISLSLIKKNIKKA